MSKYLILRLNIFVIKFMRAICTYTFVRTDLSVHFVRTFFITGVNVWKTQEKFFSRL